MEDPVRDIPHVVQLLVTAPPSVQRDTIQKYFTPDAAFTHPLCRTGSWGQSRLLIEYVYRWYKIMSPTIDLEFDSIGELSSPLPLMATPNLTQTCSPSIRSSNSDAIPQHAPAFPYLVPSRLALSSSVDDCSVTSAPCVSRFRDEIE